MLRFAIKPLQNALQSDAKVIKYFLMIVHTSQYLHWQTQTHSIPLNSNSLFTHCLRRNLGSEQNFQQFIGKFVVYHFYYIVLFYCIAKSIYSAIPYDVVVKWLGKDFALDIYSIYYLYYSVCCLSYLPSLSYNKLAYNLYLINYCSCSHFP